MRLLNHPWLGPVAGTLLAVALFASNAGTKFYASDERVGILFGALLAAASLLTSVLVGLLGVLVAIDDKPLVRKIHDRGYYKQLIRLGLWPIYAFVLVVLACVVGLFLAGSASLPIRIATVICLGAGAAGLCATVQFARLLARILIEPPSRPLGPDATVEAARSRLGLGPDGEPIATERVALGAPA